MWPSALSPTGLRISNTSSLPQSLARPSRLVCCAGMMMLLFHICHPQACVCNHGGRLCAFFPNRTCKGFLAIYDQEACAWTPAKPVALLLFLFVPAQFCDTLRVCVIGIFLSFLFLSFFFSHDSNSMRSCVHSSSKASYSAATTRWGSWRWGFCCSCRAWVWDGLWVLEALVVV